MAGWAPSSRPLSRPASAASAARSARLNSGPMTQGARATLATPASRNCLVASLMLARSLSEAAATGRISRAARSTAAVPATDSASAPPRAATRTPSAAVVTLIWPIWSTRARPASERRGGKAPARTGWVGAERLGHDDGQAPCRDGCCQGGVEHGVRADEQRDHNRSWQAVVAGQTGQDSAETLAAALQVPVTHGHSGAGRAGRCNDPGGDVVALRAFHTGNGQHQGRGLRGHGELVLTPMTPAGAVTRGAYRKSLRGTVVNTHNWA